MTYDGTLVMPRNAVAMTTDEMTYTEGGWAQFVVGALLTISYFSWGQGEKDAAAMIKKYGKATAGSYASKAALKLGAAGIISPAFTVVAAAWMAGYYAEYRRH